MDSTAKASDPIPEDGAIETSTANESPPPSKEYPPLTGAMLAISKLFIIPQRYVLAIMGHVAVCNAFTMRVCLNLAVTQMVTPKKPRSALGCAQDRSSLHSATYEFREKKHGLFDWDEKTQGLILGAFYIGYIIGHIPGGYLALRYGGKWVLGLGLMCTVIGTLLTPVVTKAFGAVGLWFLRVFEGIGEGPVMPALMAMVSQWSPGNERARFGAIIFGGAQIGNILGSFFSGLIMDKGTWEDTFYFFGICGIIWFILWGLMCYSSPNTHPFIDPGEKKFLNENVEALYKNAKLPPTPWCAMIRSCPVVTLIIKAIGHDWGYFTMVTDLPKYMVDVLDMNIKAAGVWNAVPYIVMWLSAFVFAVLCDFGIKNRIHSILNARKIYTAIAAVPPGICIMAASYSGCDVSLTIGWFIAAMGFMGAYYSGMKVNVLDLAPNYAGMLTGLTNGTAAVAAVIVPYMIGALTPDRTLEQWRTAFWVCFGVLNVTTLIYITFAKAEQLWWDDVDLHGYPPNWKKPLPGRKREDMVFRQK